MILQKNSVRVQTHISITSVNAYRTDGLTSLYKCVYHADISLKAVMLLVKLVLKTVDEKLKISFP